MRLQMVWKCCQARMVVGTKMAHCLESVTHLKAARKATEQARRAAPVIVPPTEEERAIRAEAAQVAQASAFVTPEGRLDMSLLQTFAQPQAEPERRRYRFWVEFTQDDIDWFKRSAAERGFRFGTVK